MKGEVKMKRNSKRFLSLFLAVPMTLSLMSMPVSAAPTGSADQQVQEETAAPETSEDTQEDADTDTAEETQDSAAGADQESRARSRSGCSPDQAV